MSLVYTEGILVKIEEIKKKKTNNTMTCKFLQTSLLMELQLNSNRETRIVTCHLY